ncbi:MAG: S41 family peptidase [Deltaproteobacteria bacterium]|nr:S41 family peptidase [Deltaproteobacteria bacterium]
MTGFVNGSCRRALLFLAMLSATSLPPGLAVAQELDGDVPRAQAGRGQRVLSDPEALFRRVLTHIQDEYVDEVERRDLFYAAIRGMVRELDPHSDFLDPQAYRAFQDDLCGIYGGAGFQVEYRGGQYEIVKVFPDSPAERVDLRAGDVLLEVEGAALVGLAMSEILARMRGEVGTVLALRLRRGDEPPFELRLVRQAVELPTVQAEFLEPGYVLVRIHYFHEDAATKLDEQLRTLDARSPDGLRGVILDVRDNPGGVVDEAVGIADLFLSEGVIVSTRGRTDDENDDRTARAGSRWESLPVTVLVNDYTASSAEILAAALRDNARATLIGAQTFGKGTVQRLVELLDGSALRLTVSRLLTPAGEAIQGNGIVPDLTVGEAREDPAREPALRETDLPRALGPGTEAPDEAPVFDAAARIEDLAVRLAYQVLRLEERRRRRPPPRVVP